MARRKTKTEQCRANGCSLPPLIEESYCWRHLPNRRKVTYKKKIEDLLREGRSLVGAELYLVDLENVALPNADLSKAILSCANFRNAYLPGVIFQDAYLNGINLQKAFLPGSNLFKTNLTKANLMSCKIEESYLQEARLWEAKLQNAQLELTNLRKAEFYKADLEGANLQDAYCEDTDFSDANLEKVNLRRSYLCHAHLSNASLKEADLSAANLKSAYLFFTDLRGANLEYADLSGACMEGVLLDDVRYLTWKQINKVGEEKIRAWDGARDAYRRLKNYFHQQGQYDDESKAYYREKLMAKHETFWECFHGGRPFDVESMGIHKHYHFHERLWQLQKTSKEKFLPGRGKRYFSILYELMQLVFSPLLRFVLKWPRLITYLLFNKKRKASCGKSKLRGYRLRVSLRYIRLNLHPVAHIWKQLKVFPRWFGLWFSWAVMGFGERWWLTALWAVGFVLGFGFVYRLGGSAGWFHNLNGSKAFLDFWDSLYFSVLAFSTFGFAEFKPIAGLAKVLLVAEIVMGYVFLGTLVTLIARKMGR